jgi:hypothetical protein
VDVAHGCSLCSERLLGIRVPVATSKIPKIAFPSRPDCEKVLTRHEAVNLRAHPDMGSWLGAPPTLAIISDGDLDEEILSPRRFDGSAKQRSATHACDCRSFIIPDADTGDGRDPHGDNLVRGLVEVGMPGYCVEDQGHDESMATRATRCWWHRDPLLHQPTTLGHGTASASDPRASRPARQLLVCDLAPTDDSALAKNAYDGLRGRERSAAVTAGIRDIKRLARCHASRH